MDPLEAGKEALIGHDMAQRASKLITGVKSKDPRQDKRRCGLSCVIFQKYRRSCKGLRVSAALHGRRVCTLRRTLLVSAAFRGQAEVRPSPHWPCEGTAEGQEEAAGLGREPPEAETAPWKVTWLLSARGVGRGWPVPALYR